MILEIQGEVIHAYTHIYTYMHIHTLMPQTHTLQYRYRCKSLSVIIWRRKTVSIYGEEAFPQVYGIGSLSVIILRRKTVSAR